MPTSHHSQISKIMDAIIAVKPRSILDIGAGFGKYGVLCREYMEFWDGREQYRKFKCRIDAVEAFKKYITPVHEYVYDNIHIGDISEVVGSLKINYDLVLMIDVLEHITKSETWMFFNNLLRNNRGVLISTPRNPSKQGAAFNNPYEEHVSSWTRKSLKDLAILSSKECYFISDNTHQIVYIGNPKEKKKIAKVNKFRNIKQLIGGIILK